MTFALLISHLPNIVKTTMRPLLDNLSLNVEDIAISGIRQRDPENGDAPKLLCIHGWLDNANSFIPLMPFLPSFDLVAIDLPGCGYSDHLPHGYAMHDICYQLVKTIDALGWDSCHLVGHSLGGCIAPMLAVARPQLINSLTLIEASGPLSEPASKLPERMAKSMDDRLDPERYTSRVFPNKQAAIDVRLNAAKMHAASAKLIIDRQVSEVPGGFKWRFDPKWRMASAQYQTEAQVRAVLSTVACPTLTVIADDGFLAKRPETEDRLGCLKNRQSVSLAGHHHVHMDSPEPVAAAMNDFLGTMPAMGG